MIALDIFATLAGMDLQKREWIILSEVLMRCYGPRKARTVILDVVEIEYYSGLDRHNARRAIKSLVAKGILLRHSDGSYSFVKDYELWVPPPSGGILRYALSALARFGKLANKSKVSTSVGVPLDPVKVSHRGPVGPQQSLTSGSNGTLAIKDERACVPEEKKDLPSVREREKGSLSWGGLETSDSEPDPIASTPQRAPEDLDAVREAARILAADLRTQHLGQRLLAESNTPGLVALDGWRFVRAANLLLGPQFNDAQRRRGFPLLVGIARNLDKSERDAPTQPGRRSKNPVLTPEERASQRALFNAQLSEAKR